MTKAEIKRERKKARIKKKVFRLILLTLGLALVLLYGFIGYRVKEECLIEETKVLAGIDSEPAGVHRSNIVLIFSDGDKAYLDPYINHQSIIPFVSKELTVTIDTDRVRKSKYSGLCEIVGLRCGETIILSVQDAVDARRYSMKFGLIMFLALYLFGAYSIVIDHQLSYNIRTRIEKEKKKRKKKKMDES